MRAARVMGLNVCGVDLLRANHGPVVMEVNSSPGLEGVEKATEHRRRRQDHRVPGEERQTRQNKNPWQGMSDRDPIEIAGIAVSPGKRRTIDVPVTDLSTHTPINMPVEVIHGRRPGPVLFVCGAIHGDEINGVEIVRRLMRLSGIKGLRGTLIAVPIVNVFGFLNNSRYLPDRRDLNRSFPGRTSGSLAGRLADLFMREIVSKSTHGIDLHTAAIHRDNYPQIRADLDNPEVERLARAFGAPLTINADLRPGSLRGAAADIGVPVMVYEGGEALRFDELPIRSGVNGVVRCMRELGMLRDSKPRKIGRETALIRSSIWVRAPQSGVMRATAALGRPVRQTGCWALSRTPSAAMRSRSGRPPTGS